MIVKQRETQPPGPVIDLTSTPYFSAPPIAQQDQSDFPVGSSRERLRGFAGDDVFVIPDYGTDRPPAAHDSSLRFGGGLGAALSYDVAVHPVRARLHHVDVLTVLAITVIVGVGAVMLTMVAIFKA
jgi:hypothetical protein